MDKAKGWHTEPERDWFIGAREAGGDAKINGGGDGGEGGSS